MDDFPVTLWALGALGLLLLIGLVRTFNRLISARNGCRNARGGIDANLMKRHDLIPNLVRIVKGYTDHEREVLRIVTEARTHAVDSLGTPSSPDRETELTTALATLHARIEAYPDLKAGEQFIYLSKTLTEVEEQISASRRAFNAHVFTLNNLVEQFPTLIVARLAGFGTMKFFDADPAAHTAPSADLG